MSDQDIVCSFCGRGVSDVECMVTGNGEAGICAACIEQALSIVQQRRGSTGVDILAAPNNRRPRRARAGQSVKPTEHQVTVLEELLAGGYICIGTPAGRAHGYHLLDRDGTIWREAIRSTTIGRLMDERWIERPAGEHRWSISAAGRLAVSRNRVGDFGLVLLKGGVE